MNQKTLRRMLDSCEEENCRKRPRSARESFISRSFFYYGENVNFTKNVSTHILQVLTNMLYYDTKSAERG